MQRSHRALVLAVVLLTAATAAIAAGSSDIGGIVKAQIVIGQIQQVMNQYQDVQTLLASGQATLDVPKPRSDVEGKYIFPFRANGQLTEWGDKAVNAQVGAEVGTKAGEKATEALASKVPFGGLMSGLMKGKTKELAAVTAIGGWDYIKQTSDISFDKLEDYSVFMHVTYGGGTEYEKALAAAMAIYPELEKTYQSNIDAAYKKARASAAAKQ
ncbi:MAG TPA: hypothetical protein VMH83_13960 [Candidatus Acidoferrum sp.]|nr:hypothetical protein [Candidatus Acidoferrum sp.]